MSQYRLPAAGLVAGQYYDDVGAASHIDGDQRRDAAPGLEDRVKLPYGIPRSEDCAEEEQILSRRFVEAVDDHSIRATGITAQPGEQSLEHYFAKGRANRAPQSAGSGGCTLPSCRHER
jgi:hypothetical protein